MSVTWYIRKTSPRIRLNAGRTESGGVKTISVALRNVKSNCWETSAKTNMNNILEDLASSGIFIYSVYNMSCTLEYEGAW